MMLKTSALTTEHAEYTEKFSGVSFSTAYSVVDKHRWACSPLERIGTMQEVANVALCLASEE